MRKIALEKIDLLFERVAGNMSLYLPVDQNDGKAAYTKWEEGAKWSNALNTVKSPKDFFFPQTEDMMEFKVEGKNIEVIDTRKASEDFVVFGVRACDVRAFDILDRVFLTEPRDSYYATKREHGTIVAVACARPSETCFCSAFGIDPAEPGADVTAWKTESELYLQSNTEKGERIIALLGGRENITLVDACMTRLRVTVKDLDKVADVTAWKAEGALGLIKKDNGIQAVYGPKADVLKSDINDIL